MRKLLLIGMGLLLACSGGCATMLRGEKQKVKFDTDPPGATVSIKDAKYTTPVRVPLERKDEYKVTVSKEGYRSVFFTLKAQWDGASLPAFAAPGGSASVATDRATGADLAFYSIPKIKLEPCTDPQTPALELFQDHDDLLTKEQYDKAQEENRRYKWDMQRGMR